MHPAYDLLPEEMRSQAFIAGGYAACPALASDVDLWVYVPQDDDATQDEDATLDDARRQILTRLKAENAGWVVEPEDESQTTPVDRCGYDNLAVSVRRVGRVQYCREKLPIHIMVVDAPVCVVLQTFDISTHQIALTPDGDTVRGPEWTPLSESPVQLRDTPNTAARMEKIRARYAHLAKVKTPTPVQSIFDFERLT